MKKEINWGTWISVSAVAAVCIGVTLKLMSGSAGPDGAETAAVEDSDGKNTDGKNTDGKNTDGKNTDGKNADGKNADGKNADGKNADGKNADGENADGKSGIAGKPGINLTPKHAGAAEDPAAPAEQPTLASGYRINTPDATFILPRTLDEISGLSASREPDSLWAIHDERNTLFRISITDGSVLQEVNFGKRGDYEAVEEVGTKVFIARSDGALVLLDPPGSLPVRLNFETRLGLACDLEGAAYEAKKKRLLLSCKNESRKSAKSNKAFEIYAMAIDSQELEKEPAFILNEKSIDEYIAAHPEQEDLKQAKGKSFAPSGLAVHPKTGEIYIVSTRGNMLVVLDPKGELVRVDALDPAVHPQPEGITFRPDGTLFISSEAHGKRAQLHVFKFHPSATN